MNKNRAALKRTYLAVLSTLALGGCVNLEPLPLSETEILQANRDDRVFAQRDVEPISGELTLEAALARALKYNLERRARMLEEALALRQLDVSNLDILPKLLAQAGYTGRDNDMTRSSLDTLTGQPSNSRFISQERNHFAGQLGMSWSLLDAGMGYIGAQQQSDRVLISSEKRRKAMHILMQDVRIAFWRVASAQRLRAQVSATIGMAEEALADSRKAEEVRIRNPLDALRYQRQLLENLRLLEAIDQELSAANVELASLINAPLSSVFRVAEPKAQFDRELLSLPAELLEETAMAENADIREQQYNGRIARLETRRIMVSLFPNLTFNYGVNYDSDKYLVNNDWREAGLQVTYNLFNLFTADTRINLTKVGVALADQRRVAVQMAVMSQVHLARQQFANALSQFARADAIWDADRRISDHVANRELAKMQTKLDRVGNETAAILSLLRRYQAMAQVHAAEARLQATLGLEPRIPSVGDTGLADLARALTAEPTTSATLKQRAQPAKPQPKPNAATQPDAGGAEAALKASADLQVEGGAAPRFGVAAARAGASSAEPNLAKVDPGRADWPPFIDEAIARLFVRVAPGSEPEPTPGGAIGNP